MITRSVWVRGAGLRLRACAALTVLVITAIATRGPAVEAQNSAPPARHVSSLRNEPGYVPLVDPESTSVLIGRRVNAPLVSAPFTGGARNLDELGRMVCRALHHARKDSLLALCVTEAEFRDILWREFPQSRPAVGLQWEDAWTILGARLADGCDHAIRDYGGHHYEFLGFQADSVMRYKNFTMKSRLTLIARDDEGQVHRMTWLRAVVERKGRVKIYSTDD